MRLIGEASTYRLVFRFLFFSFFIHSLALLLEDPERFVLMDHVHGLILPITAHDNVSETRVEI